MVSPKPKKKVCKDCKNPRRDAKYPGPRCYTCNRALKDSQKAVRRATHVEDFAGITEAEYQEIYRAQGGVCYLCRRATGTGKYRLAIDHDHAFAALHCPHDPKTKACRRCVRGLLCRRCNRNVLGHLRDDIAAFQRCIEYLTNPPARRVLARREEDT